MIRPCYHPLKALMSASGRRVTFAPLASAAETGRLLPDPDGADQRNRPLRCRLAPDAEYQRPSPPQGPTVSDRATGARTASPPIRPLTPRYYRSVGRCRFFLYHFSPRIFIGLWSGRHPSVPPIPAVRRDVDSDHLDKHILRSGSIEVTEPAEAGWRDPLAHD